MAQVQHRVHLWGILAAALLGAVFALVPGVEAAGFLPLPDGSDLDIPQPEGDTGLERLENILGPIGRVVRILLGAIAVALIVIAGFTMTLRGDNEETVKNQRTAIIQGVGGLALLSLAGPVAAVFDFRAGNFLADPELLRERAIIFDNTTYIVITFVKYLLGSLATLFMIRAGAVMVASNGAEETITREKKNLALGAGGLLLIVVSDLVVRQILYSTTYNEATGTQVVLDQNQLLSQLVAVTNLLVSFVGPILMLALVAGGVLYVTAGGDEERMNLAKKIMMNSVIGIAIIYGAFALVSTVISGVF